MYLPRNVLLIQFVIGYSRAMIPKGTRPSWNPWINPSTSFPWDTKPNGAPNPTSDMISYATYTAHGAKSKGCRGVANFSSSRPIQCLIWASMRGSIFLTLLKLYGPAAIFLNLAWTLASCMLKRDSSLPKLPVM